MHNHLATMDSRINLVSTEKRFNTLHKSNLETVAFISKMPPTEHEVDSFKLDTAFFTVFSAFQNSIKQQSIMNNG